MADATLTALEGLGDSAAPWRLTDLIDVATLQSIQDTFAKAFGLPTVIINPDGTNATAITHRQRFCEDLTRTSSAGGRCTECDACAMEEAARTRAPAIFECWNGLYDCAIPIAPKGQVVGYFLCGEAFAAAPDPDRYRATAREIGVDADAYVQALGEVVVVPYENYEASVRSMHVLAEMIAEQAAASIDSLRMLEDARRAKDDTAALMQELDTVLGALADIAVQPDYHSTLQAIADNLAQLIPWDSCVISLIEPGTDTLVPVVVRDPYPEAMAAHRVRLGEGIAGRVAASGVGRRFADVTADPDFTPIPGVPVEPESTLIVPMAYNDEISGVITLSRFERRTFSDHELRVLEVFSSQASVAIQVSRLASEKEDRLREERAFGRLLRAMSPRTKLEGMLMETAQVGMELLDAEGAVVIAPRGDGGQPAIAALGLDGDTAAALGEEVQARLHDGLADDMPDVAEWRGRSTLLLPLHGGDGVGAAAVFLRHGDRPWDHRLAAALTAQASLGVEKARMHERERRALLEYQRLAELGTELVMARDADEVAGRLVSRTADVVGADLCFIARIDSGPEVVRVELRHGRRADALTLQPAGRSRVASYRLAAESAAPRSLFDAWAQEVFSEVARGTGAETYAAEPLRVADRVLGGLFVAWRGASVDPSPEHRRVLGVLAAAAGASLGRFATYSATDTSLRQRVTELEALTQLAERISGLMHEAPILDELLAALVRAGRLDGALYAVREGDLRVRRSTGLGTDEVARLVDAARTLRPAEDGVRCALAGGGHALVLPVALGGEDGAVFVGVGAAAADAQLDRVLETLVRYGSVALENAHLHDRQREAIERLERQNVETVEQYDRLQRVLSVHDTLTTAVLEGRGLASVVRSLAQFLGAEILVVSSAERVLARAPARTEIDWRPERGKGPARTTVARDDGADLIAAPAVVEGEVLAWVIARVPGGAGDIERAAVEYGALLTALDLLRERTALEVETRLRGGFLEDLFKGDFVDELMAEQALAFGFDLRAPSRVFLVEAVAPGDGDADVLDVEAFYTPVLDSARAWGHQHLVAPRGAAAVAIVHEEGEHPRAARDGCFEERLLAALRRRFPQHRFVIGVGTECRSLADYRRSYAAARRAVDLMRLLGRSDTVFSFRSSTVETLMLQSTEPEVLLDFIRRYVEPLDAYDGAHASDLRHTLQVYFEAGGNLEEAARRLHIHVSTLRYRLKKVGSLLDVDVKAGGAGLDLQVALRAADVLAVHHG